MSSRLKSIISTILVAALIGMTVACSPQAASPTAAVQPTETAAIVTLKVSGSGSVTPILSALVDEFHTDNPGYAMEVLQGSDTGDAVRGTVEGVLNFAAMSRLPKESETEQEIEFVQFGTSSTAVYVHPDVGVTELTSAQVTGLFDGSITNWSEVGGADEEVIIYIRDPDESNTVQLRSQFIGEIDFAEAAQLMNSQTDMQNSVQSITGAIGYGTWATVVSNKAKVTSLTIDEIGVDNPTEALTSIMGIGYLKKDKETIQAVIDWLLSANGRAALESVGVQPTTQS